MQIHAKEVILWILTYNSVGVAHLSWLCDGITRNRIIYSFKPSLSLCFQDTVIRLCKMFDLSKESSTKGRRTPCQQCNMCIILGLLAEKLAGPSSVAMLTQGTLEYLVANLVSRNLIYF